ncbi:hypothetical protein ACFSSC_11020 [Corynebacterium mendelii]|uniref:Peptidase S1 domain-containing protein n=1 Tax=Corynebacterium mendelii TaxID=2765362 RepID=A0A939E2Z4_9CORY|nr:hypothetical protein [Corynebacterium mendelii]MBN9644492.1 hypothetical protein [Corynebacterium mendelii]
MESTSIIRAGMLAVTAAATLLVAGCSGSGDSDGTRVIVTLNSSPDGAPGGHGNQPTGPARVTTTAQPYVPDNQPPPPPAAPQSMSATTSALPQVPQAEKPDSPTHQPKPSRERRERYHNSSDWEWLTKTDRVVPGVRVYNVDGKTSCSAGWFAHKGERKIMVTAGHCGSVGDRVVFVNKQGEKFLLGRYVVSDNTMGKIDIGLVDVTDSQAPWYSSPPLKEKVTRLWGFDELQKADPMVCRLGFRTGMTCGDLAEITNRQTFSAYAPGDRGDSGGPVFAFVDKVLYPVGVTSYRNDYRPDQGWFQGLKTILDTYGLQLYG